MSSPEVDSNGIKWLFAHGTQTTIPQSRDNPGDHRWSHDTPGAGKGYEVTWIITPDGVTPGTGGDAGHTALKHGGPNHSGDCGGGYSEDGTCCCWYDIGIRANGDLQFQTERPHPSNHDFDGHPLFNNVGHEMEGHSTGLKIIAYPHKTGGTAEDGGIHIKFYINSDALTSGVPNNNWRLAADIFDTGQILGDGYEWPDYQELEVRNSDTDESGFFHDSVYFRFLTDADLQALRSGDPGGGGGTTIPPPPSTGGTAPGLGAVINTTYPVPSNNEWLVSDAEKVIKDTLERGKLPARNVDFANEWYCVIGPVDAVLRDDKTPGATTTGGGTTSTGGFTSGGDTSEPRTTYPPDTNPVNRTGIQITAIMITINTVVGYPDITARQLFDLVAAEEMVEVQTDPFFDGWNAPAGGETAEGQIGDEPCDFSGGPGDEPEIDTYSDGFCAEAYWSNRHNNCVLPGIVADDNGNSTRVTYHLGLIQKHPKIILIFWGHAWETRTATPTKTQLISDIRDKLLGTDSQYFSELNQYSGIGIPVWGAAYQQNNFVPSTVSDDSFDQAFQAVEDLFARGVISPTNIDFDDTQFILITEYGKESNDFSGSHTWGTIDVNFGSGTTTPPPTGTPPSSQFPDVGARHDCFKPTILIPGTGGGVIPPDTGGVPPPGASVIKPIVAWGVIQVVDPATSIIHSSIPDWNGNNTITRPLAKAMIQSQVNTDPFERFGPMGWARSLGNTIGSSPCRFSDTLDNVHVYSDGLGVEAYWSNLANNCMVPGRGDPDLGTSTAITNHGGRIMKNPLIVLIFWGADWSTRITVPTVASITGEVKDKLLDEDNEYFGQLGQYGGCGTPQFGASVINTNVAIPSDLDSITTLMAMAVVKSTLQSGALPTSIIDFNNTWFCVIPPYPSNILHPVNTTTNIGEWYDVFQPTIIIPGGTGNEEGGGTDPNDLDTITGTISFKRDINVLRTSACAGTDLPPPNPEDPPVDPPGGGTGTAKFYTVTGTSSQKEISNESSSDDRTRIVEKINSSSSAMNGKLLKQADVLLKKESGTTAVTPLVYFKIWNSSHAVVYTSPTTFTPNSLTTSFVGKTFDCSTNTHTLVVGDEVGIEFTGTDPDEFIYTAYQTSEGTGSSGSYSAYLEGSSWDNQTSRRTSMTLWE